MKFGLTPSQYQYLLKNLVSILIEKGAKVYCFGSRARGDFTSFSDIDLMVESENDLSFEIGELKEKMIKSNFPFKVDLVEKQKFSKNYLAQYDQDKTPFQ
jgi:predicted nucleotidyltransferase